jgi:hypothetical protein
MGLHPGRDPEQAVRALLLAASDDLPPATDLLREVRRRTRRHRALVPSVAAVAALGVLAAAALTASTVTGTALASAQELVAAAVTRTARDGYRVRVTSSKTPDPTVGITRASSTPPSGRPDGGRRAGQGGTWVDGTVDVDRDGRVRRLEFTSLATDRPWAVANGVAATVHAVLEFSDFGVDEPVTAPPADQEYELQFPSPEDLKDRRSRATRRR